MFSGQRKHDGSDSFLLLPRTDVQAALVITDRPYSSWE